VRKTHIKTKQLSPRSLDKLLQSFFKFNIEMKERKRKRKRYESSESSDLLNSSSSSFSSSSSSSSSSLSFSSSSSSSSSSSKRRKKSSDKKSRRRKEKRKSKEKKKKKKEKKCDADSKRQRRKRREEEGAEVVELDSKKKKRKCETLDKKEITEITTGAPPSAPRDEDISDKNNRQHEGKDEVKRSDAPAPVDATPPVPGFGAAMTLEQYRELAKQKTYLQGTVHAKDKAEADAENKDKQEKLSRGWWPCQSYKCDGHMNPKMMDKCNQCGAMRTLSKSGGTFKHRASDAQIAFNANRR
jgi:hypothetical protein